jgi:hypothetical protein
MPMQTRTWLRGAALIPVLFAATAAFAARETSGQAAGLGERVTSAACAASGDAAQSTLCRDGRMLWGLCETGFRSERLPNAGVYACFLHSL